MKAMSKPMMWFIIVAVMGVIIAVIFFAIFPPARKMALELGKDMIYYAIHLMFGPSIPI